MGVMEARRRILLNQPHLVSASGNPIAFQTDMAAKMGVKAHFSPVQSGSGDPSPSNVRPITGWTGCNVTRCGKNIAPDTGYISGYYINASGEIVEFSTYKYFESYIRVKPSTTYSVSMNKTIETALAFTVPLYDSNKNFIQREVAISSSTTTGIGTYTGSFSTTSGTQWIRLNIPVDSTNIIIAEGNDATYTPYSGAEYPVTFPAVGKNLLNNILTTTTLPNGVTATVNADKSVTLIGTASSAGNLLLGTLSLPAGSYTAKKAVSNTVYINIAGVTNIYGSNKTFTLSEAVTNKNVSIQIGSGAVLNDTIYPMIEAGSSSSIYEPFTNTLYGGYVDYERGEVVATHQKAVPTSVRSIGGSTIKYWLLNELRPQSVNTVSANAGNFYSNMFKSSGGSVEKGKFYVTGGGTGIVVSPFDDQQSITSTSDAFDWLESSGTYFIIPRATPIHYPLTPTLIKSLKGANTIWSDMNGNLEIGYWKH